MDVGEGPHVSTIRAETIKAWPMPKAEPASTIGVMDRCQVYGRKAHMPHAVR